MAQGKKYSDATKRYDTDAVHGVKLARLRRLAAAWLQSHDLRAGRVRIDVIGILRPACGPAVVRHLEGVGG